jgi:hypothetical protein
MMNRSCLLRTLQRPRATLRKGTRRSLSASSGIGTTNASSGAAAPAAAAAAAAEDSGDVNREIAILKKLDHPNVVKLYEVRWLLALLLHLPLQSQVGTQKLRFQHTVAAASCRCSNSVCAEACCAWQLGLTAGT